MGFVCDGVVLSAGVGSRLRSCALVFCCVCLALTFECSLLLLFPHSHERKMIVDQIREALEAV